MDSFLKTNTGYDKNISQNFEVNKKNITNYLKCILHNKSEIKFNFKHIITLYHNESITIFIESYYDMLFDTSKSKSSQTLTENILFCQKSVQKL